MTDRYSSQSSSGRTVLRLLAYAPALITVAGSAAVATAAAFVSFSEIQLLQAVIALLALIGTTLLTEKLVEGRQLRKQIGEMDSRLTEALAYAHKIESVGLDRLVTHRRSLPPLEERLEGARHVAISGGSLFRLANEYRSLFERLAESGCTLRFLMTDPESEAAETLARAVVYESDNVPAYRNQIRSTVAGLVSLESRYPALCEVKLFAIAPTFSLVQVERERSASLLVEIYPFRAPARDRPMLMLDKERDPELYNFFSNQYHSMWCSTFARHAVPRNDVPKSSATHMT